LEASNIRQKAAVGQNLANMHKLAHSFQRSKEFLYESLQNCGETEDQSLGIVILVGTAYVCVAMQDFDKARDTISKARSLLREGGLFLDTPIMLTVEIHFYSLTGESKNYIAVLVKLRELCLKSLEYEYSSAVAAKLANFYSLKADHALALKTLYELSPTPELPLRLVSARGMLLKRRGNFELAISDLRSSLPVLQKNDLEDYVKAQLHLADALRLDGQAEASTEVMREVVPILMRQRYLTLLRPDLEELIDLTQQALLDPETAPYMEAPFWKASLSVPSPVPAACRCIFSSPLSVRSRCSKTDKKFHSHFRVPPWCWRT
jgi:tetratricopeptide (TPR) repeat protein